MDRQLNIIGKRKIWYLISIVLILAGLISFFTQGLNKGLDFTGGNLYQIQFETMPEATDLRTVLNQYVSQTPSIQKSDNNSYLIRTADIDEEQSAAMLDEMKSSFGNIVILRNEHIGPTIGRELISKAETALIIAVICMLLYITIRFKFNYAISAIVPLIHDVLLTLGLFSIMQLEVDSTFVAAILTILGYSINNTIVIFDRIRENTRKLSKMPFSDLVNISVNQTIARSINTSVAVLLLLVALFFFGGASTKNFALALLVGVVGGCYSSVFIAGSILTDIGGRIGSKSKQTSVKSGSKPTAPQPVKTEAKPVLPDETKSSAPAKTNNKSKKSNGKKGSKKNK